MKFNPKFNLAVGTDKADSKEYFEAAAFDFPPVCTVLVHYHSGLLSNKFESIEKDARAFEIQNKNWPNNFFSTSLWFA